MTLKNNLTSLIFFVVVLSSISVQKTFGISISENFTGYSSGDFAGNGSATGGWSGPWQNNGGLATASVGNLGVINGETSSSPYVQLGVSQTTNYSRQLSSTVTNQTAVYIYGLIRVPNGGVNGSQFGGIGIYQDGTERFLIGESWTGNEWSLAGPGFEFDSGTTINSTTRLLCVKINQFTGEGSLWVDPDFSQSEASQSPDSTGTHGNFSQSFNTIRIRSGNNGHQFDFDNLNLLYGGDTPFAQTPNGSTAASITEFMALNNMSLNDEDGDASDWIEIHNASTTAILDLVGWYLTDDVSVLTKWQLPSLQIQPGGYAVIFASGKDRATTGNELHTNFKLSASGEYLALVMPDGTTIKSEFSPTFPSQFSDIPYGTPNPVEPVNYLAVPTPGAANSGLAGANINSVSHFPLQPLETEDIVVTATVTQLVNPIQTVSLIYRVMYGSEISLAMNDNGTGQDVAAGDGIYTTVIPSSAYVSEDMVRWKVTVLDNQGSTSRSPQFSDPLNSPEYYGTMVANPAVTSLIPILYWFVEDPSAARTDAGTRASCFFLGRFYDNYFVRRRGLTTASWPKRKFKFDFNTSYHFKFLETEKKVEEINLQSHLYEVGGAGGGANTSFMRENLAFELMRNAGVAAPLTQHIQLRQNKIFYGLYSLVEQVDEDFLKRNGLDDTGALYKATGDGGQADLSPNPSAPVYRKVNRKNESWSDLTAFAEGINNGAGVLNRFEYLRDNVNIWNVINEMAAHTMVLNHDRLFKNYYVYRDPQTLEWYRIPWDTEMAFEVDAGQQFLSAENNNSPLYGDDNHPQDSSAGRHNRLHDNILDNTVTREMYLRRLRTLSDEILQQTPGIIESRVNFYDSLIHAEADADDLAWGSGDIDDGLNEILNVFLPARRNQLFNTYGPSGSIPLLPNSQSGNPVIGIGTIEFNPVSGNQDEEYIELTNANSVAVDISGWEIKGGVTHTFDPGTVIPSNHSLFISPDVRAYRERTVSPKAGESRLVQGAYQGHLSNFGETLILVADDGTTITQTTYQGAPSDTQLFLRVTELHFHPAAPTQDESLAGFNDESDFEFIELQNISTTATLNLTGVTFTDGIDFDFSSGAITSLAPGEFVLVVRNQFAFEERYGTGLPVAGSFTPSKLNNDGEKIKIEDATNSTIQEFDYNDNPAENWPAQADGTGPSMIVVDVHGDYDLGLNWTASNSRDGTPGAPGGGSVPLLATLSSTVNQNGFTLQDPVLFTATFSRAVNNFVIGDIQVTGGNAVPASFTGTDGDTNYTFEIMASDFGEVNVLIPNAVAQSVDDSADNSASNTYRYIYGEKPTGEIPFWHLY